MRAKILWVMVLSLFFNLMFLGADVGNPPPIQAALNEWENVSGQTLTVTNGNMSSNSSSSIYTSLVMDKSGQPCITWEDNAVGNYEIYFAKWNGTSWVNANGTTLTATNGNISNNLGSSFDSSLALDSNGNPNIAWEDNSSGGNREIYFARWNGAAWVNANGITLTATNGNVSNNSGGSQYPSLAIDSSDFPNIAWDDSTPGNYDVYFARWNGSQWINANGITLTATNGNVSNKNGVSDYPSLKLDSSGKPFISWEEYVPGQSEIYFARWNGTSWVNAAGQILTTTNGNMSNNTSDSRFSSLEIDLSGNPCIAWQDSTPDYDVFYAKWDGSQWVNAQNQALTATNCNVTNNNSSSYDPSLVINKSNIPCITWADDSSGNFEICYTEWEGFQWVSIQGQTLNSTNCNLSNNNGQSFIPCLDLDNFDNPCVVWEDNTPGNKEVYFARWHGVPQSDVDKFIKTVDTGGDNDFDDELSKVSIGDEIRYKLSITFTKPGVAGEIMDFVPEGTAYLGMESGHKTPTCSYSDGKDWLYYSKNTEPDNKYAKRNGAVLKWKLNSDDGLSQEIIYKVKVTTNFNEDLATMGNFSLHGKTSAQNYTDLKVVKAYESVFNSQSTQASFYSNSLISPANSLDLEITDPIKDQWWTIGTGMNIRWNPPVVNPKDNLTFSVKIDTDKDNVPDTEMLSFFYPTPIGKGYACVVIDRSTWENKKPLKESEPGDSFAGLLTVKCLKWDAQSHTWIATITKTVNIKITKFPVLNYAAWADPDYGPTRYDNRHPLILIHGLSPLNPGGESQLWDTLLNFLKQSPAVSIYGKKFKPYIFQYDSGDTFWGGANSKGIEAVGKQLLREIKRNYIDLEYAQNEGGLYLIGHSMGGLVARSFMREPMQENKKNGPFCGDGVTRLITLATPHHGSKYANFFSPLTFSQFIDELKWDDYVNKFSNSNNVFLKNLNNPQNKHLLFEDKIIAFASSYDKVELDSGMFFTSPLISDLKYHTNRSIDFGYLDCSSFVEYNTSGTHFSMAKDQKVLNSIKQFLHAPIVSIESSIKRDYLSLTINGQGFGDRIGKTSFRIVSLQPIVRSPIVGSMEWSNERITLSITIPDKNNSKDAYYDLMQVKNKLQTNQYKIVINIEGNGVESSTSEDFPSANIVEIEPVKKDVELNLIPSKSVYCRGDTINMKLRIRNNSKLKISNPQLSLVFPKELVLLSSRPQGSASLNKWSINIGNLNGGSVFEAELKFKLKEGYSIPEHGINLSFTSSFTSSDINPLQDYTTVKYISCAGTESISMTINWTGFNTKNNIAKAGEEISAKVMPEGGSSPYEIVIDWGDGTKEKASEITSENYPTFKHTYDKSGKYTITITCTDQYGKQCVVTRKITVK